MNNHLDMKPYGDYPTHPMFTKKTQGSRLPRISWLQEHTTMPRSCVPDHYDISYWLQDGLGMIPGALFTVGILKIHYNVFPGARLTKAYDVTIQRYRNSHAKIHDSKMHILRCMGSKFCVKFQRCPLKFHTKFWTHTPQNMHFMRW